MKLATKVKITINNKPWIAMRRRLTRSDARMIDVGWWGSRHPSGVPTAQVAAWNEEGHMNGGMFAGTRTPPRPFIRVGFYKEIRPLLQTRIVHGVNLIAQGRKTWTTFYRELGNDLVELMKEQILEWEKPPNKPSTVEMKGFNDPLIETGALYDSVKFRISRRKR